MSPSTSRWWPYWKVDRSRLTTRSDHAVTALSVVRLEQDAGTRSVRDQDPPDEQWRQQGGEARADEVGRPASPPDGRPEGADDDATERGPDQEVRHVGVPEHEDGVVQGPGERQAHIAATRTNANQPCARREARQPRPAPVRPLDARTSSRQDLPELPAGDDREGRQLVLREGMAQRAGPLGGHLDGLASR